MSLGVNSVITNVNFHVCTGIHSLVCCSIHKCNVDNWGWYNRSCCGKIRYFLTLLHTHLTMALPQLLHLQMRQKSLSQVTNMQHVSPHKQQKSIFESISKSFQIMANAFNYRIATLLTFGSLWSEGKWSFFRHDVFSKKLKLTNTDNVGVHCHIFGTYRNCNLFSRMAYSSV